MKKDNLGDRCKWFEKNFSNEIMIPELPVIIRLDGNNFHNWTKGLEKPFDKNMVDLMIDTTKFLVKETNAVVGYVQSDEITLILYSDTKEKQIYNDGKKQKILSKLTGKCVSYFNDTRPNYLPNHNKTANFDCRIYQVPSLEWATLQLLWRELDATKNSISMLAQSVFPHSQLQNLHSGEMQDKLMLERGINWNDLESKYKRGTYVKNIKTDIPFSKEELNSLPPKHNAHKNPDLIIERNIIKVMDYPIFSKIKNKVGVIFNNENPEGFEQILIKL